MQINFTGHHLDVTDALRNFTTDKLGRITRHYHRIDQIQVTFAIEKLRQTAEATLHIPGATLHAKADSEDMYAAIDSLVDKLERQLEKHKEK